MSDLLDYYLSDKRPPVPTYSKSRFKENYFINMGGICLYTAFDELCFTLWSQSVSCFIHCNIDQTNVKITLIVIITVGDDLGVLFVCYGCAL